MDWLCFFSFISDTDSHWFTLILFLKLGFGIFNIVSYFGIRISDFQPSADKLALFLTYPRYEKHYFFSYYLDVKELSDILPILKLALFFHFILKQTFLIHLVFGYSDFGFPASGWQTCPERSRMDWLPVLRSLLFKAKRDVFSFFIDPQISHAPTLCFAKRSSGVQIFTDF